MALPLYLAMTGAEMIGCAPLPHNFSYMACHFSPYGPGLSNIPVWLPEGSLLILNDQTPIRGHDPEQICRQLAGILEAWNCRGLLLDFERPNVEEAYTFAAYLCRALPGAVGVSAPYGEELGCPVFLPPVPPDRAPEDYLSPWQGREIWLEAAMDALELTLTPSGCTCTPLPFSEPLPREFRDEKLCCHYQTEANPEEARFLLRRTRADVDALLTKSEALGVTLAVGLWQEFQ